MRRYWIPDVSEAQSHVDIDGDVFHHVCEVCRQDVGSKFEVLTESGHALLVEITQRGKKNAQARVLERRKIPALPKPYIHLAMSLPKIATFEAVLEKAVELGTAKIWPFYSDYSFAKSPKIFTEKAKRFEKIVLSATQQSGRGDLMPIAKPISLEELLQTFRSQEKTRGIFAYEGEGGEALRRQLSGAGEAVENLWIFVGSEGGFSVQEVEIFKKFNLFPVSLGQQVLRVETACVTLLGIIKYELGLF